MIIKYWCKECKTYIVPESVTGHNGGWSTFHHSIHWKNGITWYTAIHKVVKIIELINE